METVGVHIKQFIFQELQKSRESVSLFEKLLQQMEGKDIKVVNEIAVPYVKREKWTEPILEYMTLKNKKIKTVEIAIGIEPMFEVYSKQDREYIIDKISYALHNLSEKKKVIKERDVKKGFLWSLKKPSNEG